MTILFKESTSSDRGESWAGLARIFHPVRLDLGAVERRLAATLAETSDPAVREIADFLLECPGKRLRPALVLLCARAARGAGDGPGLLPPASVDVGAAVELIHMASLVHDDLIDGATVRHHRASIQAKWGKQVAVSTGDFLCAKALQLVADCADPRLFAILGSQLAIMCEGELQQVVGRGDFSLCEHHCLAVIEKKTAALFGASCGAGALTAGAESKVSEALQNFGFHFGVAFQILDDCRDLLSDREKLGKLPGQDLQVGDVTLPLLYAIQNNGGVGGLQPWRRGWQAFDGPTLAHLREAFRSSPASQKIAERVSSNVGRAVQELKWVGDSDSKTSLRQLADHMTASVSRTLAG